LSLIKANQKAIGYAEFLKSRMVQVGLSKIALWPTHPVKHCNRKCGKIKGTFGWGGGCIQFTLTVAGQVTVGGVSDDPAAASEPDLRR
jgi:alpha-D-ribose 1-methylphosphonate 5-phosphate C-P lyase